MIGYMKAVSVLWQCFLKKQYLQKCLSSKDCFSLKRQTILTAQLNLIRKVLSDVNMIDVLTILSVFFLLH